MRGSKTGVWAGGTIVLALLITAASWLLLISPVLATASETATAAESTRLSNDALEIKVARLAEQFTHLEEYRGQLAELRVQVPTGAELSAFLRRIDTIAVAHSVTVVSVSPGTPAIFTPAVPVVESSGDATVDESTAEAEGDPAAVEPVAAPANAAPVGMVDIPLSINVVGTYEQVMAFVNGLQTEAGRLLLVTSVTGSSLEDAEASGGRPATAVGDLEVSLSALLYVLPEATAPAPVDPAAVAPALPAQVPGKNPLIPVS